MLANRKDNTILGTTDLGQANVIAVDGTCASPLCDGMLATVRGLFLRLGAWCALFIKRTPAGMTLRPAMCPTSYAGHRHQRHGRWSSGVGVDPGSVGVR